MLKWADQWQLEFHPDKCVKMSINNKELENRTYNMDDIILRNVKQEKDIGVIVDDQLKFEDHMYEKIKKANNMMGLIRRSFIHLDEEMFLKLYKALVRPHLEYANVIWHPTKIKDIISLVFELQAIGTVFQTMLFKHQTSRHLKVDWTNTGRNMKENITLEAPAAPLLTEGQNMKKPMEEL